jgi:aspartate aminotransferase/aminotransferase
VAWSHDVSALVADYESKRDRLYRGIKDDYELVKPQGAFYAFPRVPQGTGTDFVTNAIQNNLLIIPGTTFSSSDTHFRISFAADDATIDRGIEVLKRLARQHRPNAGVRKGVANPSGSP